MEKEQTTIEQLRQQANKWFKKINKKDVQEVISYTAPPQAVIFIMKYFIAMILDEAIDESPIYYKVWIPSQQKLFQKAPLFHKFWIFFYGHEGKNLTQITAEFDSIKMSQRTLKYLERLKEQYTESFDPEMIDQRIEAASKFAHNLWNWCKCMLKTRQKLMKEYL